MGACKEVWGEGGEGEIRSGGAVAGGTGEGICRETRVRNNV